MGLFRSKRRSSSSSSSSSSPVPVPATLPSPPFSRTTRSRRGTTTSTSTVGKRGRTIGDGNGNGSGNSNGNGHIRTAKLPSVPRVIGEEESTEGTKATSRPRETDTAIGTTPAPNKLAPREESTTTAVGTEKVNKLRTQNSDVSSPPSVSLCCWY